MTIADLRDIITDLPDAMPIAIPGYELGTDPATQAGVFPLGPRKKIYSYEGVLGRAEGSSTFARNFLCFGTNNRFGGVEDRLREAGIEATYNPEKDRWYSSGWSDDLIQIRFPFAEVTS